ncbi:MAG: DUF2064 domain-containing protein [Cytophagales bacterium]
MKKIQSDTAILIFTRSLESECEHKKLSEFQNGKIIKSLMDQTEKTAKKSCLPYFISSDEFQYGDSFGERLYNEMQRVYNAGYEKIIVIGNDSPSLTSEVLINAAKDIENNRIVLGPSSDGGAYLIGIHRKNLNRHQFINLPWLSDRVYHALNEYSDSNSLTIINSGQLDDIDNQEDLINHITKHPLHRFSLYINSILASDSISLIRNSESARSFEILGFRQLRAPPSLAN